MAITFSSYTVGTTTPVPINIDGASQVTIYATANPIYLATEISGLVNTSSGENMLLPIDIHLKFDGGNRTFYAIASGGDSTVYVMVVS